MSERRIHAREYTAAEIEQMQPGPLLDWLANQASAKVDRCSSSKRLIYGETEEEAASRRAFCIVATLWDDSQQLPWVSALDSISTDPGAAMRALKAVADGKQARLVISRSGSNYMVSIVILSEKADYHATVFGGEFEPTAARALALYARAKQLEASNG